MTQAMLTNMTMILTVIDQVLNGSLTSGSETSGTVFISALITVMNRIILKTIDEEYFVAFSLVISVTNVQTLNAEARQILIEIGKIL